jgi:hypothetical protein
VDDRQFGYTTHLEKKNPAAPAFIALGQLQANWKSTSCDGAREIEVEWTSDAPEGIAFRCTWDTLGV